MFQLTERDVRRNPRQNQIAYFNDITDGRSINDVRKIQCDFKGDNKRRHDSKIDRGANQKMKKMKKKGKGMGETEIGARWN